MNRNRKSVSGFTLVELLVVIAIIGVLVALLLPAVQMAREAARRSSCSNNLHQIGIAVQNFHDVQNQLPPLRVSNNHASWFVLIMPYMEQGTISDLWTFNEFYSSSVNAAGRQLQVKSYYCPSRRGPQTNPNVNVAEDVLPADRTPPPNFSGPGSDPRFQAANNPPGALGDYAGNCGTIVAYPWLTTSQQLGFGQQANGAFAQGNLNTANGTFKSNTAFRMFTDGLSNTFLAGEKHVPVGMFGRNKVGDGSIYNGVWTLYSGRLAGPYDPPAKDPKDVTPSELADAFYARRFGSYHPGVIQFVFCDSSVRPIRTTIDLKTYGSYAVRDEGEVINDAN